jgi:hypothetical protein
MEEVRKIQEKNTVINGYVLIGYFCASAYLVFLSVLPTILGAEEIKRAQGRS